MKLKRNYNNYTLSHWGTGRKNKNKYFIGQGGKKWPKFKGWKKYAHK